MPTRIWKPFFVSWNLDANKPHQRKTTLLVHYSIVLESSAAPTNTILWKPDEGLSWSASLANEKPQYINRYIYTTYMQTQERMTWNSRLKGCRCPDGRDNFYLAGLVWCGLVASQLDGSTQQPLILVIQNKQTRH
jgi:hypothetical protein